MCRFCGRGICKEHAETHAYILALFDGENGPRAVVVEDALWCKACKPRPNPIDLPELR